MNGMILFAPSSIGLINSKSRYYTTAKNPYLSFALILGGSVHNGKKMDKITYVDTNFSFLNYGFFKKTILTTKITMSSNNHWPCQPNGSPLSWLSS